LKRYSENIALIVLNIILEYILLFGAYIVCGLIRLGVSSKMVAPFYPYVIRMFAPVASVICFMMVAIFFLLGNYKSIHFRSGKKILSEAFTISLIGGLGMAMVIFFTKGDVFSRALLIMLIPAWTLTIYLKRVFFEILANKVFSGKIATCNVLIIGSTGNARRYYEELCKDSSTRYTFVGYLSDNEVDYIDQYLGKLEQLQNVILANGVNKIVIAEDGIEREDLKLILSTCSIYGIEAQIIPIYSDYIFANQKVKFENGIHCINVNMGLTSNILGVNIAVTDMNKTLTEIEENLDRWRGQYICVSNVHTTVMAHDDEMYRKVQNGAVRALPDGGPLSSYSRAEGKSEAKRVTGPDLMREALIKSRETGWKHFFYGSTEKTLNMLRDKINREYPGAEVVGFISPPYRDITPEEDEIYINEINKAKPDFVWVGLGAPKQEIWMSAHKDKINALMIGVGAAFDYESGNLKRAPKWMQKCNLEWLYRFMQEPRRLFKRYFITNIKFLWLTRR